MMNTANRICRQCGTPLAPNETFCSNCGWRYVEPSMTDPTQRASSTYQSGSNPNQPQIDPTQYPGSSPSYGSSPYGNTAYGGSSDQNFAPPPPPNMGYNPPPPASAAPYGETPGLYGQQPSLPPMPPGGFPPAPQPKRGPNVGLILGAILLLLILVGGGIFFLTRPKNSPATSTAGGSTPAATQSVATPTPTPLPPIFTDNFADNSKGWNVGSSSGFSSAISNNAMNLSEANHKVLPLTVPAKSPFTDFSATTTLTLTKADRNDSAGLYVRGDDNLHQGYLVEIYGDNTYDIYKYFADSANDKFLVHPTASSTINSVGQQNKLTVIMKGSKLVVEINDAVVNSITDPDYTSGQIAIFAANGSTSNGVKASFSSIVIYPAPNTLPS